jgi:Asp-tRNA(Asn)/Glu-tRNA(Gln) amidotransferase A subunit family amidase
VTVLAGRAFAEVRSARLTDDRPAGGAPQLSVPVAEAASGIGLSFIVAPGEDGRVAALAEKLGPSVVL